MIQRIFKLIKYIVIKIIELMIVLMNHYKAHSNIYKVSLIKLKIFIINNI